MAKISFSQKPQRLYYVYTSECGHIYSITTKKPEVIADGGGYWSCYFECDAYHKVAGTGGADKYYRIYEAISEGNVTKYYPVNSTSFYKNGNVYKYDIAGDGSFSGTHNPTSDKYYNLTGSKEFVTPKSSLELPYIKYDNKTYYFDKLITNGAKYFSSTFTPLDAKVGPGTTTYGDIITELVKDSININAFKVGVDELPEYLRGGHKHVTTGENPCPTPCPFNEGEYDGKALNATVYNSFSTNTGYQLPADYLSLFGPLFMEKLCDVMKEKGEAIVEKYTEGQIKTKYDKVTISVTDFGSYDAGMAATVTSTPNDKTKSPQS